MRIETIAPCRWILAATASLAFIASAGSGQETGAVFKATLEDVSRAGRRYRERALGFAGELPCAGCPAIRYDLNLFPNNSFFLRMTGPRQE